jgi:hypothetical protein
MSTVIQSEPFVQKLPRSVLRHRPTSSETDIQEFVVLTPPEHRRQSSYERAQQTKQRFLLQQTRKNAWSENGVK